MHAILLSPSSFEWMRLLEKVHADIYYLPDYVEACAQWEGGEGFLFAATEDENIWIQPLIIRPIPGELTPGRQLFDAVSPYGYSGPLAVVANGQESPWAARATARLKACLAKRSVVTAFIRLNPILKKDSAGLAAGEHLTLRGKTVVVDLKRSDEHLWNDIRANHRRHINRLLRSGFTATMTNDAEQFEEFQEVYRHTMARVGASDFHMGLSDYLCDICAQYPKNFHICSVKNGQETACIGLFTEINGIVQYHLSGTVDKYRPLCPSKLMLHCMTLWAKRRKNEFFHLGGGVGSTSDSLMHFKIG